MNNRLGNIFLVSGSTVISRISGFARDALFASMFGIGDIGSAFLFAFTIPNLFRRLLGEGALSSAAIPILSKLHVTEGPPAVLSLLKIVIRRLLAILAIVVAAGCGLAYLAAQCTFFTKKWTLPAHFLVLLLPYMIFVCAAALISAGLNVFSRFFASSLNAIWLNFCMIASLLVGKFAFTLSGIKLLDCLSLGVILGGMMQCLIPFWALKKLGIKCNKFSHEAEISEILKLFWPGFWGAAISQINLLISRNLAYVYCASAISVLYLANRIVELPLGVFGIAIATVVFPDMSKLAADGRLRDELNRTFNHGMFMLLWILLPSMVGLYLVRHELLSLFFEWGTFGPEDTAITAPVLAIYCVSMPFLGISNFLIRSFHALKDTKTPAKIGLCVLAVNFTLTIILVRQFGTRGVALATTLSLIVQTMMLYYKLCVQSYAFRIDMDVNKVIGIILGLLSIYLCIKLGQIATSDWLNCKKRDIWIIFMHVPLAAASYAFTSMFLLKPCKKQ
ncbi:MAG: murein biosynthesis integral membrane protein MurJ [Puniceicoccales bacterium]|jgi:putative peptidoglycan lipid II flippase|nr:murein biosynthesis integral membrane protein MurJ [Puniceicoccales bacterium]